MLKKTKFCSLLIAVIILFQLSGCFGAGKGYPAKNFYILDVTRSDFTNKKNAKLILELKNFTSPSVKSGKEFVYKFPGGEFKSDYYNEFFVKPHDLIKDETSEWLEKSGFFKAVLNPNKTFDSDFILEGNIDELYADFSGDDVKSILGIQFFISKNTTNKNIPFFHKNYRKEIITDSRAPKNLVIGWNQALEEILTEFEEDIAKLKLN